MMGAPAAVSAAPSRRIGGRRFALSPKRQAELTALFLPAIKAFGLGYIMDILPAIIKALLRFVTSELKVIRAEQKRLKEERSLDLEVTPASTDSPNTIRIRSRKQPNKAWESLKLAAPSLARLPILLKAILKALFVALGAQGMAQSCFWAMAGWKVSEAFLWWPVSKYYALKLATTASEPRRQELLTRARVTATFLSASVSSALALMVLQHHSRQADERRQAARRARGADGKMLPAQPAVSDSLRIDTSSSWIPSSLRSPRFGFASSARARASVPRIASLAPAGHFLSRLTSLTVPGTPGGTRASRSPSADSSALPAVSLDEKHTLSPVDNRSMEAEAEDSLDAHQRKAGAEGKSTHAPLGKPSPTIDLTLFALVRGMDTLVRAAPLLLASSGTAAAAAAATSAAASGVSTGARPGSRLSRVGAALKDQAEGLIFVVCCAQIMWAWFYHQERLPPTYVKWITNLATMDERLLLALRGARYGKPIRWNYTDSDLTPAGIDLVSSLAEELGHPYEWGDPTRLPNTAAEARQMLAEAKRVNEETRRRGGEVPPVDPLRGGRGEPGFVYAGASGPRGRGEMGGLPCEIIHCGVGGGNCEANAALRWLRGWRMSMAIYFPVHLLPRLLFNPRGFMKSPFANLLKVLLGAARSAAFLATYIVGNWYPICLARSRLPLFFPSVSFNFWDSGLGPLLGSIACGFSIFIEEKRKRAEMALYVAPRALFAVAESAKSGWLSEGRRSALWAERIIFGMAVGTVVSAGRYRPDLLRGITGAMGWVVRPPGAERTRNRYARSQ